MAETPNSPQAFAGSEPLSEQGTASALGAVEVLDFRKEGNAGRLEPCELRDVVFLVGFMGAGKTSVARKLARYAGVTSVDMDTYIERAAGKKVTDIFAEVGEDGFRTMETEVLRDFAEGAPQLVSCGGGIVLRAENREILKKNGFVVYLQVTAAEAASRISNVASRPLFGDLEQAQRTIEGRLPLYEEVSDLAIDTAGRGSGAVARDLYRLLKNNGVLVPCKTKDPI